MELLIRGLLFSILLPNIVLSLEDPIYFVNNVTCEEFTVLDFYIYPYSDTHNIYYARIKNEVQKFYEYVHLNTKYFYNHTVVGDEMSFIDYETYGSSGMLPESESLLYGYLDKADFDSVSFIFSYLSGDGSKAKFDENALKIVNTLIQPFSGSIKKISGSGKNHSQTLLHYPSAFVCIYRNDRCLLNKQIFLDGQDNILSPDAEASFYAYIDLPVSYDSIQYLPNYSVSLTGNITSVPFKLVSLSIFEPENNLVLFQNYPNPFNSMTTIRYQTTKSDKVLFQVVNQLGQIVIESPEIYSSPGLNTFNFDSNSLPSGIYTYSISSNSERITKKMTILK